MLSCKYKKSPNPTFIDMLYKYKVMYFYPQGLHLVETFYSNSPPTHSHPKVSVWLIDIVRVFDVGLFCVLVFQVIE